MGILDWLWPFNWFKKEDISEEYIDRAMKRLWDNQKMLVQYLERLSKRITHFKFPEVEYQQEKKILSQISKSLMTVSLSLRERGHPVQEELTFLIRPAEQITKVWPRLEGFADVDDLRSMITHLSEMIIIFEAELRDISKNTGIHLRELCVARLDELKEDLKRPKESRKEIARWHRETERMAKRQK